MCQDTYSLYQDGISRHPIETIVTHPIKTPCQDTYTPYQDTLSRRHVKTSCQDTLSRRHIKTLLYPIKTLKQLFKTHHNSINTNLRVRYPQSRRTNLSPECNVTFEFQLNWLRYIYAHESLPTEYFLYVHFPRHWCCGTDTFLPT